MNVHDVVKYLLSSGTITSISLIFVLIICPSYLIAQNKPINHYSSPTLDEKQSTYGPVVANEGLWDIAETLRSDEKNTIAQVALALFKLNPAAFSQDNMNALLVGSILNVPSSNAASQLSSQEAITLVKQHWQQWQNSREMSENKPIVPLELAVSPARVSRSVFIDPGVNIAVTDAQSLESHENQSQFIHNAQVPSVTGTETPSSVMNNLKNFNLPDYLKQMEWYSLEQIILVYKKIANLEVQTFDMAVTGHWLKSVLLQSPMLMILIGLTVFFLLVMFFRRQEMGVNLFDTPRNVDSIAENDLTQADKIPESLSGQSLHRKSSENIVCSVEDTIATDTDSNSATMLGEQDVNILTDDLLWQNSRIIHELANHSDDFVNVKDVPPDIASHPDLESLPEIVPLQDKTGKASRKGRNLLELAFDKDMFAHGVGFIQDDVQVNPQQPLLSEQVIDDIDNPDNLLDSVEQIRFVNDRTHSSKVEAFWDMTQDESMTDELLSSEFSNFKDNDKLDVFIAEFETIMASLSSQTPAIEKSPDQLEHIVQFKLSIHFIKVLSDMMQASHLKHFSDTVIEFLEDIIDGKTKMSNDVTHRLLVVVRSYNHYIHFIKSSHSIKL